MMKAIMTRRPPRTARKLSRFDTSAVETRRSVSWAAMVTSSSTLKLLFKPGSAGLPL